MGFCVHLPALSLFGRWENTGKVAEDKAKPAAKKKEAPAFYDEAIRTQSTSPARSCPPIIPVLCCRMLRTTSQNAVLPT